MSGHFAVRCLCLVNLQIVRFGEKFKSAVQSHDEIIELFKNSLSYLLNPQLTNGIHKMYTFEAVGSFHISEPQDTYIYDIVPVGGGLAAISSDDNLRLLDPQALNGPPLYSIRKINTDVTCLKAIASSTGDGGLVCTAGRDGRVCIVDPRAGTKVGEARTGKSKTYLLTHRTSVNCL